MCRYTSHQNVLLWCLHTCLLTWCQGRWKVKNFVNVKWQPLLYSLPWTKLSHTLRPRLKIGSGHFTGANWHMQKSVVYKAEHGHYFVKYRPTGVTLHEDCNAWWSLKSSCWKTFMENPFLTFLLKVSSRTAVWWSLVRGDTNWWTKRWVEMI